MIWKRTRILRLRRPDFQFDVAHIGAAGGWWRGLRHLLLQIPFLRLQLLLHTPPPPPSANLDVFPRLVFPHQREEVLNQRAGKISARKPKVNISHAWFILRAARMEELEAGPD